MNDSKCYLCSPVSAPPERACCRIGLDWELVNYCEIDRWASLSYSMVNQCSESLNLRDVRCYCGNL